MLEINGYAQVDIIHEGRQSRVLKVRRQSDDKIIALKTPAAAYPGARQLSSLAREYTLLSRLDQEGVPRPYDLIDTGTSLVMALEFFDCDPLSHLVRQGPVQLHQFFIIALAATRAVGGFHRRDLCHRDISSGNILFNPETKQVAVIDLGSALDMPRQARPVINPRYVEGSRAYMSPEQTGRMNRGLDYRTDFYSLGAVFYQLLTGQVPFPTDDPNEMIHCHIAASPKDPLSLNDRIHPDLSRLVLKLLSKDPADRYQSADGLSRDLERCRELQSTGEETRPLNLGQHDLNDRFMIPETLHGREEETRKLMRSFTSVSRGRGRLIFISGHSGVGKTSLVRELYKPLAEKGGRIAWGKYDQFLKLQPFSGFVQAFTGVVRQILGESPERIRTWKDKIREAAGANTALLIEVIPELELLTGPHPSVPSLPVEEARTRFNTVFHSFVSVFADPEQPLIIFLDDLQWIDAGSLSLIEMLSASADDMGLMLIGAYRDNEVPATHPLAIALRELADSDSVWEMNLAGLTESNLGGLLADTLSLSQEDTNALNGLLYTKTHGNPLFYKTLLSSLYTDGHLSFDYDFPAWVWDLEAIKAAPYADNVVEMLGSRLDTLAGNGLNTLSYGALIGNTFGLDLLTSLTGRSRETVAKELMSAVTNGLITPLDEDYELFTTQESKTLPGIEFRFTHDRIQQTAYAVLSGETCVKLHWQLGNILRDQLLAEDSTPLLFDAVSHLNQGASLANANRKRELVSLNLDAGRRAKAAAAFTDAAAYLTTAREMLGRDAWKTTPELARQVDLELAEASYLISDFERAEALYTCVRENADRDEDLLTLINIQAKQYHHQGRYEEAVVLEIEGLSILGIPLPETDDDLFARFAGENEKIAESLDGQPPETLCNRPETSDSRLIRKHELLFDLFADGYLMGKSALLVCAAAISTRLTAEEGLCPMSGIGLINYATCLCAGGEYEQGYAFGKTAVTLADRHGDATVRNYTYHLFALSVNHWFNHLPSSYAYWRTASKVALESGSPYAGWVFLQLAHVLFACGNPLSRVDEQVAESAQYLKSARLADISFMLKTVVIQPLAHLRGDTRDFNTLDDDSFSLEESLEQFKDLGFIKAHIYYAQLRATLLSGRYQPLSLIGEWMALIEQVIVADFIHADCALYFSLHLTRGFADTPEQEREAVLAAIDAKVERFTGWAGLCPDNFGHKLLLIRAEKARITGNIMDAMDLYDETIDAALNKGFINDAAIAAEFAGLFWKEQGRGRQAITYLEQALSAYDRWGARGKMRHLKTCHPELQQARQVSSATTTVTATTGTEDFSARMDLASVVKASQAISRHMVQDDLAAELTSLAVENAGATRGLLLLRQGDTYIVNQKVDLDTPDSGTDEPGITFDRSEDLSPTVVNYVINTGSSVVLDHPETDGQFGTCPYINTRKPKSLCCLPIMRGRDIRGVLYLENSRVTDAFRADRLEVLGIIASQADISLENARIYGELDNFNKTLERKVEERTLELAEKNRELEVLSTTDQLTGIYNRRFLEQRAQNEIERTRRYTTPLSVILMDIDHFKSVNDTHGHDVGDAVLVSVARCLSRHTRTTDIVGRWGGEEFLILVPGSDDSGGADLAEKLRLAIEGEQHGPLNKITASFGVTGLMDGDTFDTLVKRADKGLYQAKTDGRNQVVTYPADLS